MDLLLKMSVFLWISVGFLFLPEKSVASGGNNAPAICDFVFNNLCFEFVEGSETWSQARNSCEKLGGELLKVMNNQIKNFLQNNKIETNNCNFTWWLGKGLQDKTNIKNGKMSKHKCTYMKLNPFKLIVTSDCNQRRGFICTHHWQPSSNSKNTILSNHATRPRLKRNTNAMAANITNISRLLEEADIELRRMEVEPGEPTNVNRDNFIQYLLKGTTNISPQTLLQNKSIIPHIINCSNAIFILSQKKCDIRTNPNPISLFEDISKIFQAVTVLLGSATTNSFVTSYQSGTLYQSSFKPSDIGHAVLGSQTDGPFARLPSFSALQSKLGSSNQIITQLMTFSMNPHPSNDSISGTVISITLSNRTSEINVTGLAEMIEIFLPRSNASALTNNTVVLEENTRTLTQLNVSDPNMTIVFSAEPSVTVSLVLVLSQGSTDSSTSFNSTAILSPKGGYRWLITPQMLQQTPGVWYVDTRLFNSTWVPGLTLSITSFMSKCMYWDTYRMLWSTDGCRLGEKTTPELTHCLCNHLTLFASSFFVMPNYVEIDRTAELFATVTQNYVVLALLCAFFSLYLVTLLWACYADRRARNKRKMTLLEDNHPGAQYNYLISVQTGHRKNAGTSATVTVKLIGSEGESDTHTLTDPDKPVFERGAVDMFVLSTPFPIGEVTNIRLQHNNSGGHPSWYINKVTIQDLQTRHVWHFFCACWLSTDREDGLTKKTFNAAKKNEITSFRNIFQSRTSTGFRDEHIWVSIVDPPSRSPFTRAQRVSCCMCLLLCTMAINIAFWNVPIDPNSTVLFSIGTLEINWQEFMVGVECGLLMFPINILIIAIFRSIRPRIILKSKKDDSEENLRPSSVTVPSILKDTEEVISMVSRSPRNKMSEMQRLESAADLCFALDRVHEFIQLMQGETESDPHWMYCSRFLLASLSHLLMCLEKVDEKNFPSPQDYKQALNTTNLLVRKAEMVFSCHLASCPAPVKKKRKTSVGCWLPWWCVFLGWFLLLSISGVSTFFTLLYGFQYGREKSIKWVMSLGLSLFQSIFILQPLKILGVAVFFALLLKPVAVEESEEVEQVLLEQQDKCRQYSDRHTV